MFVRLALVVWFLYASSVIGLNTSCCDFYHLKRQNGEMWNCGNCLPGYHFVDDCEFNGGSAKCSPCPYGYFMETRNVFRACRKCKRSCPYNTIINFHCTSTSDLKCGCTFDKYLDKDVCVTKTKCQPGYGVNGTTYEGNTKCVKCPEGTISENNSYEEKCMPDTDDCRPLPCVNNGTCTDLVNNFICTCPKGFFGRKCEHDTDDCRPLPCVNNGTCTDLEDDFICTCPEGFSGRRCEHDTDDCLPRPCMNNGTCTDLVNDFTCICQAGFSGRRCEHATGCDTQPCQHGGRCVPEGSLHLCVCPDGFKGTNCEEVIPTGSEYVIVYIVLGVLVGVIISISLGVLAWLLRKKWKQPPAETKGTENELSDRQDSFSKEGKRLEHSYNEQDAEDRERLLKNEDHEEDSTHDTKDTENERSDRQDSSPKRGKRSKDSNNASEQEVEAQEWLLKGKDHVKGSTHDTKDTENERSDRQYSSHKRDKRSKDSNNASEQEVEAQEWLLKEKDHAKGSTHDTKDTENARSDTQDSSYKGGRRSNERNNASEQDAVAGEKPLKNVVHEKGSTHDTKDGDESTSGKPTQQKGHHHTEYSQPENTIQPGKPVRTSDRGHIVTAEQSVSSDGQATSSHSSLHTSGSVKMDKNEPNPDEGHISNPGKTDIDLSFTR